MITRPTPHNLAARGFSTIEVAIFMVAASVIATISAVAVLDLSGSAAEAGSQAAGRGLDHATGAVQLSGPVIATRGDIDVDANNVIDLAGNDIQAVAILKLLVSGDIAGGIDLTPSYTANGAGVDPDFSTSQTATVLSVITDKVNISSAAWTVTFPGDDDGDNVLERGEQAEITIWLHPFDTANGWYDLGSGNSDPFVDVAADALTARGQLTIRITPTDAPQTVVQRTLPISLTASILLD